MLNFLCTFLPNAFNVIFSSSLISSRYSLVSKGAVSSFIFQTLSHVCLSTNLVQTKLSSVVERLVATKFQGQPTSQIASNLTLLFLFFFTWILFFTQYIPMASLTSCTLANTM